MSRSPLHRKGQPKDDQAGFSLIETIVALVVLGLTLTTMLQIYRDGLSAMATSESVMQARLLARSLLDEIDRPQPSSTQGRHKGLRWTRVVEPIKPRNENTARADQPALYRLRATVQIDASRSISLETVRWVGAGP